MLTLVRAGRFKRDARRAEERGKDMARLKAALSLLIERHPLPDAYGDHPLKGDWKGYRDLHLEPDWLLIYRIVGDELPLTRTRSHADLFTQ